MRLRLGRKPSGHAHCSVTSRVSGLRKYPRRQAPKSHFPLQLNAPALSSTSWHAGFGIFGGSSSSLHDRAATAEGDALAGAGHGRPLAPADLALDLRALRLPDAAAGPLPERGERRRVLRQPLQLDGALERAVNSLLEK